MDHFSFYWGNYMATSRLAYAKIASRYCVNNVSECVCVWWGHLLRGIKIFAF